MNKPKSRIHPVDALHGAFGGLAIVLFVLAGLTLVNLSGCKQEDQIIRLVDRLASHYCDLPEETREIAHRRYDARAFHKVKITCSKVPR